MKKIPVLLFFTLSSSLFTLLYAQGTLKGKVSDSANAPVEGAIVTIENTKLFSTTDSKGNYKVENIPAGTYSVAVQIVGYNTVEQKADVKDKQTTELNFNLLQKINQLEKVNVIRPFVSGQGMGHMPETYQGVIYSGLKTEVLVLDSLDANKAQDNFRETLGRLPGSNYSETEGGGFPSNGIAFRGLIPTQSVEIQTRQNGYNLAADVYGYPESYYLPPLIAVSEIQVIRGEASLQYGPQFGGVINYNIKDAPLDKPLEIGIEETGGSYGFLSNVLTIGGTHKKWHYFAFGQYKSTNGWRPNSDVKQGTAFAHLEYDANDKLTFSLEYTLLRNLIHMPGGLTDAEFNRNPDTSTRARNWLSSPWNLLAFTADYKISDKTEVILKSVGNMSGRYLVWKNEEGGAQQADSISAITGEYQNREVEKENFLSITNELRVLTKFNLGSVQSTLAGGVRYFQGEMWREEEGLGTTGSNYDLSITGTWGDSLEFTTTNLAPFIEDCFQLGRFSITPGFRYEYIQSTANGIITLPSALQTNTSVTRTWLIPLAGCALQFNTSDFTNIYGNIVQAYEPTTYEALTPIGTNVVVDPNLQDVYGFNSDLGWRGKLGRFINFDVDGFYMQFNREIGNEPAPDGSGGLYETNVGNAVHQGIETYVEIHVFKIFKTNPKIGDFSFFNSYAYDDSKYVSGLYAGNYEEFAPVDIERIGMNYSYAWKKGKPGEQRVSITLLYSYSTQSYADAANLYLGKPGLTQGEIANLATAEVGLIPAYHVVDWSSSYYYKKYALNFGISNLLNAKYFNLRTAEYPGPGIIPAPGANFYIGVTATF